MGQMRGGLLESTGKIVDEESNRQKEEAEKQAATHVVK